MEVLTQNMQTVMEQFVLSMTDKIILLQIVLHGIELWLVYFVPLVIILFSDI